MIIGIIIIIGMFGAFGWLFTCGRDYWYQRIIGFIIGVLLGIGFLFVWNAQHNGAVERWNNGQCEECGGSLEFSNATNWRGSHEYYYTCNECGHTEMFVEMMK